MKELILRCQRGEEDAIEQLTRWYRPRALDLAKALLKDVHSAEDVVQEALLVALSSLEQLKDPGAFYPWFRQIVRSQCNRYLRKQKEHPQEKMDIFRAVSSTPHDLAEERERKKQVKEAVASLPLVTRETTELFYFEELACQDVAGRLKVPLGTVKRRLHDSRKRLKEMLGSLPKARARQRKKTRLKTGLPL